MVALPSDLPFSNEQDDPRIAPRSQLRCFLKARGPSGEFQAAIENISRSGMLINTQEPLTDGEVIQIELPNAGLTSAHVVWTYGTLAGCEFEKPLTQGAVSAALLLSPHLLPPRKAGPNGGIVRDRPIDRASQDLTIATGAGWFVFALAIMALLIQYIPLASA